MRKSRERKSRDKKTRKQEPPGKKRQSRESRRRRSSGKRRHEPKTELAQLPRHPNPNYADGLAGTTDAKTWAERVIHDGIEPLIAKYKVIRKETIRPPKLTVEACDANAFRNRYDDVRCCDQTRVRLHGGRDKDYIHASFVDGYSRLREFICTQGPLDVTRSDFWRMIWERRCQVIAKLCRFQEEGKDKCAPYFSLKEKDVVHFGQFTVTTLKQDRSGRGGMYVMQTTLLLELNDGEKHEPRKIFHMMHLGWPDRGTPSPSSSTILLMDKLRKTMSNESPIVVHCSAGVGRTGTLVALDICILRLRHKGDVNVEAVVRRIREQRLQAIQTEEQYVFIHKVLLEFIVEHMHLSLNLKKFNDEYDQKFPPNSDLRC